MPTSWYQAVPLILDRVIMENPKTILDIGVGFGKYGFLIREALDIPFNRYTKDSWETTIDGVEAFITYQNPVHEYVYNHIFYQPIDKCLPSLGKYDVITMIDVLEHFTKDEGRELLKQLLLHTNKALIISTPIIPANQKEYLGNAYEEHKSRWKVTDFKDFDMDFSLLKIDDNQALIVKMYPIDELNCIDSDLKSRDQQLIDFVRPQKSMKRARHGGVSSTPNEPEKLHVAYVLPHKKLTGGLKMLIEQIRWLKKKGHTVDVYQKDQADNQTALPNWANIKVDRNVVIPPGVKSNEYIKDCDVVVSGWFEQIPELVTCNSPVMYWEQGYEGLFGDINNYQQSHATRKLLKDVYSTPVYLTSVSNSIAEIMLARYGRRTMVIPNGIDTTLFYPSKHPFNNTILLVGNPALSFKDFSTALRSLENAWRMGDRFKVQWVCQVQPLVSRLSFPLQIIVNPPQEQLPILYRNADIFLSTSVYEGFGMPLLEAMASGLPTICTDCGGVNMYVDSGKNSIMADPGDVLSISNSLHYLLTNEAARIDLGENARNTALKFSLDHSLSTLEDLLFRIKYLSQADEK